MCLGAAAHAQGCTEQLPTHPIASVVKHVEELKTVQKKKRMEGLEKLPSGRAAKALNSQVGIALEPVVAPVVSH
eukprot:2449937-Amphidinium_carterae.1